MTHFAHGAKQPRNFPSCGRIALYGPPRLAESAPNSSDLIPFAGRLSGAQQAGDGQQEQANMAALKQPRQCGRDCAALAGDDQIIGEWSGNGVEFSPAWRLAPHRRLSEPERRRFLEKWPAAAEIPSGQANLARSPRTARRSAGQGIPRCLASSPPCSAPPAASLSAPRSARGISGAGSPANSSNEGDFWGLAGLNGVEWAGMPPDTPSASQGRFPHNSPIRVRRRPRLPGSPCDSPNTLARARLVQPRTGRQGAQISVRLSGFRRGRRNSGRGALARYPRPGVAGGREYKADSFACSCHYPALGVSHPAFAEVKETCCCRYPANLGVSHPSRFRCRSWGRLSLPRKSGGITSR